LKKRKADASLSLVMTTLKVMSDYRAGETTSAASFASERGKVVPRWNWWALVPLTVAGAALAVPYLVAHGPFPIGLALERGYAIVCHQRPERSFWVFGGGIAVCSRCLGIYLGAALGLLFRTTRSIALRLLFAAAALNLLDAATELAGLHSNWLGVRFGLGFVLGATGALLISSSVQNVLSGSTGSSV
jgi:uncharacterized membrane protein